MSSTDHAPSCNLTWPPVPITLPRTGPKRKPLVCGALRLTWLISRGPHPMQGWDNSPDSQLKHKNIHSYIYIYYQNCSVAPGSQRSEFSRASWSNFMRNTTLAMQYAFEFSQFAMQVFRFPINIHLCIFNPQVCNLGQFAAQKIWEFCIFGIAGNKHTKELAESSKL